MYLITHTHTHTLLRAPLDEGWERRRGQYLHSTRHSQEKDSSVLREIRTVILGNERSQTYAVDRTDTVIGERWTVCGVLRIDHRGL